MSKEDVKAIKSAYEKMLEDGTANKKIDMSMMVEPDVSTIEGLGDQIEDQSPFPRERQPEQEHTNEDNTDWTQLDNAMQKRMNSLRSKIDGGIKSKKQIENESREIELLKKRVLQLEEALMLVMDTQTKLIG